MNTNSVPSATAPVVDCDRPSAFVAGFQDATVVPDAMTPLPELTAFPTAGSARLLPNASVRVLEAVAAAVATVAAKVGAVVARVLNLMVLVFST